MRLSAACVALTILCVAGRPSYCQETKSAAAKIEGLKAEKAVADSGKTAYFSSGKVEAARPYLRRSQLLLAQAESQLRQAAKEAVEALEKLRKEGRSASEISAEENRRKVLIENQQKALAELVGKSRAEARAEVEKAVALVAEAKGYTLVLDLDAIFFGGNDIRSNSRDITGEVIQKLSR